MTAHPAGFFVVREAAGDVALLRHLHDLHSDAERADALRTFFASGEMRDALWLASPELVDALSRGTDTLRVTETLYRYMVRACTRCNPFGLFTTLTVGGVAPHSRFQSDRPRRRIVRLDGGFVEAARSLSNSTKIRLTSPFYRCADHYRYVIRKPGEGRVPRLVLAQADADPALTCVAETARNGCELSDLTAAVSACSRASAEDAAAYIEELCESGILIRGMEPALTGDIDFSAFEQDLLADGDPAGEVLRNARRIAGDIAAGVQGFAEGAAAIQSASALAGHPISEMIQVDCVRDSGGMALPMSVLSEIGGGALAFLALRPAVAHDHLADFKKALADRWGDSAVPLTTAVDADFGIALTPFDLALPAPLSAGLKSDRPRAIESHGTDAYHKLVDRALVAAQRGIEEIVVTPEEAVFEPPQRSPDTFAALCAIEADSDDALDNGAFRVIINAVSGASGIRLMGRFCGVVPGLQESVQQFIRASATPGIIDADIVYSPSGRESNVIRHGRLYDYEIPIGGRGASPRENVIHVEDLLVSVHGNELALWDAKRGKRVRPHLSVAHNHSAPTNLAVYRFLCRFEEQEGATGGEWSWGHIGNAHYMPRVRMGRSILVRRRWTIDLALQRELARTTNRNAAADLVRRWKDQSGCDAEILAGGIEERVALDLTRSMAVEFFVRLVKQGFREVQEALPKVSNSALRANGRRAAHEIVVPFRCPAREVSAPMNPAMISVKKNAGSWKYLKCYSGPGLTNEIIEAVAPALRRATASGLIDRWFFVRYADPEWHVRLRFHSSTSRALNKITDRVERILRPFLESGRVWRVQHDQYISEPARFGGNESLPFAEEIFWRDSEAAVETLSLMRRESAPDWLACIVSIDSLARDFGLDDVERRRFARERRDAYLVEFDDRKSVLRHAATVARKYRQRVVSELLAPTGVSNIFALRSAGIKRSIARLNALDRKKRLTVERLDVLAALAHMSANRIFSSDQRAQEALVFDLLTLAYDSVAAMRREPR